MLEHPRTLNLPHLVRVAAGPLVAGNELHWAPPPREHAELISVHLQLTTDVTALNRRMRIRIGPAGVDDVQLLSSGNHPASTVIDYHFLRGCDTFPQVPSALGWYGPLPMGLLFQQPHELRSDIHNLQAGDQITLYTIRYMMWQDPVIL